eukprot:scaffold165019_cov68-Attheya_sp.AAC.1
MSIASNICKIQKDVMKSQRKLLDITEELEKIIMNKLDVQGYCRCCAAYDAPTKYVSSIDENSDYSETSGDNSDNTSGDDDPLGQSVVSWSEPSSSTSTPKKPTRGIAQILTESLTAPSCARTRTTAQGIRHHIRPKLHILLKLYKDSENGTGYTQGKKYPSSSCRTLGMYESTRKKQLFYSAVGMDPLYPWK